MSGHDFNTQATGASKDEWLTPPSIVAALGPFDLDPCSPRRDVRPWPTAARHLTGTRDLFTPADDDEALCGLHEPWNGRVWLNPPYGDETFLWIEKMAKHRRGIALIFARTETIGFHAWIWDRAHAVFFFAGRLKFYHVTGTEGDTANAPSCLISYSAEDTAAIRAAGLRGKLIIVNEASA